MNAAIEERQLELSSPDLIEAAVRFLAEGSRGFRHNRRRSILARRLKHVELTVEQKQLLLDAILDKLRRGDIDEQFIDQLRLCRHLDPARTAKVARSLLDSEKEYVRRFAARTLQLGRHDPSHADAAPKVD